MNIIGPDALVFGVDDVLAANQYLIDYGLLPVNNNENGGRFEALDGTCIIIARKDDPSLPAPLPTGAMLRKTVYGVDNQATLDKIVAELSTDREVTFLEDGSIQVEDNSGFVLGFQVTIRREFEAVGEFVNSPGMPVQRPANEIGADEDAIITPSSLSHVVYFVPNLVEAEQFYVERLGFKCTDRFTGTGPFLQPGGTEDHHTLFIIDTPAHMQGCEHFTFHVAGPTQLMQAGTRFKNKGYESFWGPGRHKFGSNWFWYFNSPLGCHVEYDADMDLHDDEWIARECDCSADMSQTFLFKATDKWMPGPD